MRRDTRDRKILVEEAVSLDGETAAPIAAPEAEDQRSTAVRRALIGLVVVVIVALAAYLVPLPSVALAREWSDDLGPWFAWAFFAVYTVATIAPIPRTPFTVASGVLFGPALGFTGAIVAATIAAVVAFALARGLGRRRVAPLLAKPVVATVEARLARRGWLAVGSLRLIPVCPFSLVNYLSGLSSVRPVPYLIASVVGTAPGTAAVVFLADALTGETHPAMIFVSGGLFAIGLIGLIVDARMPVND
ncbi:TVP38/TMEM64 family protein [Gordonia humi]|uniref:TVP38/TMEM64 family membrane protein n=1 Tax=Gordonia humi TaxID=686429 RepID=A0A840EYH6_9ACTN|nr:TVP38/TMEM64 family protein [Gordonia humi]MBB4136611.1 putative membrane protein YdjX (TVP38/TMEM64 family) [Gordonia humi]